jgi:hypothetical protein
MKAPRANYASFIGYGDENFYYGVSYWVYQGANVTAEEGLALLLFRIFPNCLVSLLVKARTVFLLIRHLDHFVFAFTPNILSISSLADSPRHIFSCTILVLSITAGVFIPLQIAPWHKLPESVEIFPLRSLKLASLLGLVYCFYCFLFTHLFRAAVASKRAVYCDTDPEQQSGPSVAEVPKQAFNQFTELAKGIYRALRGREAGRALPPNIAKKTQ